MRWCTSLVFVLLVVSALCAAPAVADIPTNIVDQYWVWYPTMPPIPNMPGIWVEQINNLGVSAPVWGPNFTTLDIMNVENPNNVKTVWVEVKYVRQQTEIAPLTLADPLGVVYNPTKSWISTNGQFVTWEWTLPWQPSMETVNFGSTSFYNLSGIELVEVGTRCVPEPSSLAFLASGLAGCGLLRRFRK